MRKAIKKTEDNLGENEESYEKTGENLGKREESYDKRGNETFMKFWGKWGKVDEKWGKLWENEENLRKHEESYEAEHIQLCGNATFPITFLTFG